MVHKEWFELQCTHLMESLEASLEISCNEQHVVQQNKFLLGLLCVQRQHTGMWLGLHADRRELVISLLWSQPAPGSV